MKLKMLAIITVLLTMAFYLLPRAHAMPATELGNGFVVPAIPNVQVGVAYDFATKTRPTTLTSIVLTRDYLDLRVGYLADNPSDAWICGISLNVKKFVYAVGGRLNYTWDNIMDASIGAWIGYDFSQNKSRYGIGATLIKVEFR